MANPVHQNTDVDNAHEIIQTSTPISKKEMAPTRQWKHLNLIQPIKQLGKREQAKGRGTD